MADKKAGRRTILGEASGEIEEKKSRFIAALKHVETEAEAEAFLALQKKTYYDARHHCSAFIVSSSGQEILRSNDDGEPSGSAGRPILSVLEGENLHDTIAVVTRYFGGTLLGVGGLVRAYQGAVREALKSAVFVERRAGRKLFVTASYNDDGKLKYQFRQKELTILDTQYGQDVTTTLLLPVDKAEAVKTEITDLTAGRALIEEGDVCSYDWADGEVLTVYDE